MELECTRTVRVNPTGEVAFQRGQHYVVKPLLQDGWWATDERGAPHTIASTEKPLQDKWCRARFRKPRRH